jgi:hypothetical protein
MHASRDEVLDAALKLSESDRLLIATRLMDTLSDDLPGLSVDDPGFIDELERRAADAGPMIYASELWNQKSP